MCGHVGVAGNLSMPTVKMFKDMLIADSVRGEHSTGVAGIGMGANPNVEVVKCVGPTHNLMELKRFDNAVNPAKMVLIGHNRFATVGAHSRGNAHPFEFSNVIGAHNGTLPHAMKAKLSRMVDGEEFGTDSETFFAALDENHPEDIFPELEGAWAFVWYDKRDRTINFVRNEDRDLTYAMSADGKVLMWASEPGLLRWCAHRNNIELLDNKVMRFPVDQWFSWEMPLAWNKELPVPLNSKLAGKVKEVSAQTTRRFQGQAQQAREEGHKEAGRGPVTAPFKGDTTQKKNTGDDTSQSHSNVITLPGPKPSKYAVPEASRVPNVMPVVMKANESAGGFKITKKEWDKSYKECSHCSTPLPWADVVQGVVQASFLNKDIVFCEDCAVEIEEDDGFLNQFYNRSKMYGV